MLADLTLLISERLDNAEHERRIFLENSGWIVQFLPCGHAAELQPNNPLVEKCKNRRQLDAMIRDTSECPICHPELMSTGYSRAVVE